MKLITYVHEIRSICMLYMCEMKKPISSSYTVKFDTKNFILRHKTSFNFSYFILKKQTQNYS